MLDFEMNQYEKLAQNYMAYRGHSQIIYEPDGNCPPDFLSNGELAIEVRYLNQHYEYSDRTKGLEEEAIPLVNGLEAYLTTIKEADEPRSAFVSFSFWRPLPKLKELKRLVSQQLPVYPPQPGEEVTCELTRSVKMHVLGASAWCDEPFIFGGYCDHDSGGFVVSELIRNSQICIDEKTAKIESFQHRYSVWWLILVDSISLRLNTCELEQFRSSVSVPECWDKVVIINARNHKAAIEI